MLPRFCLAAALVAALSLASSSAGAFTHVVREGETLAQIAERVYGHVRFEKVLVAAGGLDLGQGTPIVPGFRLEVPALGHVRVVAGDGWASLARELLGAADRADVLAQANDSTTWTPPAEGAEIVVPYNLRYTATQGDTIVTVAQKFYGDKEQAYLVDRYNHLKGTPLARGDLVLLPITTLPLTEAGKAEAAAGDAAARSQAAGAAREAQRKVEAEMPILLAEVRGGRWVEAVAHGSRMLASGELTQAELAAIHQRLTEAFVALDATGLAAASCAAWRKADPAAKLDPVQHSPKVVAACGKAQP